MQTLQNKPIIPQKSVQFLGPVAIEFAASHTGSWRLERPVVQPDNCKKCGICMRYCPLDIISLNQNTFPYITIDYTYCKGCGICSHECPAHCITMLDESEVRHGL